MNAQLDTADADRALKAKHRAMWTLGDYPAVARTVWPPWDRSSSRHAQSAATTGCIEAGIRQAAEQRVEVAAADELVRVCRPGSTIGLLSWTPEGFIGQLFATMRPYSAPPPPGARSHRRCGVARTTYAPCSVTG